MVISENHRYKALLLCRHFNYNLKMSSTLDGLSEREILLFCSSASGIRSDIPPSIYTAFIEILNRFKGSYYGRC